MNFRLCGICLMVSIHLAMSQPEELICYSDYSLPASEDNSENSPVVLPDNDTTRLFKKIGLTNDDYAYFVASEKTVQVWCLQQKRSPGIGAAVSLVPVSSGFYYTGNYGLAAFVSLAKFLAIGGIIQHAQKGGYNKDAVIGYTVLYSALSAADLAGSQISIMTKNDRLDRLLIAMSKLTVSLYNDAGLTYTLSF